MKTASVCSALLAAALLPATASAAPLVPRNDSSSGPTNDDIVFQNLLSAEWIIESFYRQGYEHFNQSAFVEAGFPNDTYSRIGEILENEQGHLKIFQDQISEGQVKPASCQYQYPFDSPQTFVAFASFLEVASMAFLTGLVQNTTEKAHLGALAAIGTVESRHNTWINSGALKDDPFAGPSDTVFPYAYMLLESTNQFVVNGSCPSQNPPYPTYSRNVPGLAYNPEATNFTSGGLISLITSDAKPITSIINFDNQTNYHVNFYHSLYQYSSPLIWQEGSTYIPSEIPFQGLAIAVISAKEKVEAAEDVLAGPLVIILSPNVVREAVPGA